MLAVTLATHTTKVPAMARLTLAADRIAMEACGGSHHWGRLAARLGHRPVRAAA